MHALPVIAHLPTPVQVKQALWAGGIQRSNKPAERRNTPGLQSWEDLVRV
jgi:hypothetical protein